MAVLGMKGFQRILVAFDGSENALRACEAAASLAKSYHSGVTVLYGMPTISIFTAPLADQYYALQLKGASELVERAASLIRREHVSVRKETIQARASMVQTIVEYAADNQVDLIVMGTRGMGGFKRAMIGSVSSGVATFARSPVLVVRPGRSEERPSFRSILVAIDGSESAQKAARVSVNMAKTLGTGLTVLHVVHIPSVTYAAGTQIPLEKLMQASWEEGRRVVSAAVSAAKSDGVEADQEIVEGLSPAREITEYAKKKKIDLIIVGTRGLGGYRKLLLGSVASGVLTYADCSVLVAK